LSGVVLLAWAMRVDVEPDEAALAIRASNIICEAVRAKPDARLGLPTGATPINTFRELERRSAAQAVDFSRATVFAIDEFAGVATEASGTNRAFFDRYLRVAFHALRCPDAAAIDPDAHIRAFAEEIGRGGGLDLCVLGIGVNGHIAFNEPGSARDSRARAVALTPASREAHGGAFGGLERVPVAGITLGVADLLESRRILVLAQGAGKACIVHAAIHGQQDAKVPATWLRSHPDVTWLLDAAAASMLTEPSR
jgi:glucosamine-6-phosphate deaminase